MAKMDKLAAITPYLADIGNSMTTMTVDGVEVECSHYEKLARQMWNWAMGWVEELPILDDVGDPTGQTKRMPHPPDKTIAKDIYARMEGKPKITAETPDDHRSKPVPLNKRLNTQIVSRLNNNFGAKTHESKSGPRPRPSSSAVTEVKREEADSNNPIPGPPRLVGMQKDRADRSKRPHGKPTVPPRLNGCGGKR